MKIEYRELGEVRKTTDEGIAEAYLTAWETIDSYQTSFQRGCFKRTFKERGNKIKLIWNHEKLVGKVLECREDDYGPFVKVQFNLETQHGREAFEHVKAGDVDSFSFGFNVLSDDIINKVRTFTEIKVLECGPVIFEANSAAVITDARSEDFETTIAENELRNKGWKLIYGLEQTIDEIFWFYENKTPDIISKTDIAISDFHGLYMEWLSEYFEMFGDRSNPVKHLTRQGNELQEAFKNADNIENITSETSLTESDIERLRNGKLLDLESRNKLQELPDALRKAHHVIRRNTVENLCSELRESGFSDADKQRFLALSGIKSGGKREELNVDSVMNSFDDLIKTL